MSYKFTNTRKALELGAPIPINAISDKPSILPTAEQLIGWAGFTMYCKCDKPQIVQLSLF